MRASNSAGRLFLALRHFSGKTILDGASSWYGEKFKNDAQGRQAGIRALSELHALHHQFIDDLKSSDIQEDELKLLISGVSSLYEFVSPPGVTDTIRKLTEAESVVLSLCEAKLPREGEVSSDDLKAMREAVADLQASAEATKSESLKFSLLEIVRFGRDAIDRYASYGASGLRAAFKRMVGDIPEVLTRLNEIEPAEREGIVEKFKRVVSRFDKAVAMANAVRPLLEFASKLFLTGP